MKKFLFNPYLLFITMLCLSSIFVGAQTGDNNMPTPITVDTVNLEKYAGLWYEISRITNRFQRKCLKNVTAFYELRQDGRIDVTNRCFTSDGKTIKANGIAKVADTESNAKLKVSFVRLFGLNLFWGDYWIIGLAEDYRYAIVGHPARKYGWVLSRTPQLSDKDQESIKTLLKNQGYNPDEFQLTTQDK